MTTHWFTRIACSAACLAAACAARADAPRTSDEPQPSRVQAPDAAAQTAPLYRTRIKPKDTILFVGDTATIASPWPRYAAAALLRLRPNDGLRTVLGGWEAATTGPDPSDPDASASASVWLQRLMMTVRPTVVVISLGLFDAGFAPTPDPSAAERYASQLDELIDKRVTPLGARVVIVLGPPAIEERHEATHNRHAGCNAQLALLSEKARQTAERRKALFIDLFTPTRRAYDAQQSAVDAALKRSSEPLVPGAAPPIVERPPRLTSDGFTPNRFGAVAASLAVLEGLGVTRQELSAVGWPPLPISDFAKVRSVTPGIDPDPLQSPGMFSLGRLIEAYDVHFDVLWRTLEMRLHPTHARRADILSMHRLEVENDWQRVLKGLAEAAAVAQPGAPAPPSAPTP